MGSHRRHSLLGCCEQLIDEVAAVALTRAKQSPGRTPRSGLVMVIAAWLTSQRIFPAAWPHWACPLSANQVLHASHILHLYFSPAPYRRASRQKKSGRETSLSTTYSKNHLQWQQSDHWSFALTAVIYCLPPKAQIGMC
jgi:hypothetical protein